MRFRKMKPAPLNCWAAQLWHGGGVRKRLQVRCCFSARKLHRLLPARFSPLTAATLPPDPWLVFAKLGRSHKIAQAQVGVVPGRLQERFLVFSRLHIPACLILLMAWLLTTSCRRDRAAASPAPPPVPVSLAQASQQTVPFDLRMVGTVEAS